MKLFSLTNLSDHCFMPVQVLGAFWYLFAIERETTCWRKACGNNRDCVNSSLYCNGTVNTTLFNSSCPIIEPNATVFDFGIVLSALQSGVVESTDFPQKFFYCFWWGLQNLRYGHVRSFICLFMYLYCINPFLNT